MSRPLLLDLFCGAGGAAMGYHNAGFDVIGVDNLPQPDYPFTFVQGDATDPPIRLEHFDVIHASPPCQAYIRSGNVDHSKHPDLLPQTRIMLKASGRPYIIENVPGAPMRPDVILCGSHFGLPIRRHRWFESNMPLSPFVPPCDHSQPIVGVYGHPHGRNGAAKGMLPSTTETWRAAMQMPWTNARGLSNAIPPAYTERIGRDIAQCL
jgi:DNA (cytosine-5)-methyltransferase 1